MNFKFHCKPIKFLGFGLICLQLSLYSFGQSNLEFYGSYIHNLNKDFKNNTQGIGVRYEWGREDASWAKYVSLAYCLPMKATEVLEAQASDSWTTPSTINVTAKYSQPMVRLEGGGKLYLAGNGLNFEGVNCYLSGGVELLYINNHPTYSEYDKEKYSLGYTDDSSVNPDGSEKFGLNFNLTVGAGLEKNIGPGNVFLQAALGFPCVTASQSNSDIADFTPIPVNVNLGYKIPLSRK